MENQVKWLNVELKHWQTKAQELEQSLELTQSTPADTTSKRTEIPKENKMTQTMAQQPSNMTSTRAEPKKNSNKNKNNKSQQKRE